MFKSAPYAVLVLLSLNVHASFFNALNGTDYEWLELTETQGLSRDQVEVMLTDPSSNLYGYQYASRSLIEDLFLSYATWDGLYGYHGDPSVVSGVVSLVNDLGITSPGGPGDGIETTYLTVDGYTINYDIGLSTFGFFGESGVCGLEKTCESVLFVWSDAEGNPQMVRQDGTQGWDSQIIPDVRDNSWINSYYGSHLVREAVVPVPAAFWLFGSGLIGLIGFAKRKARA